MKGCCQVGDGKCLEEAWWQCAQNGRQMVVLLKISFVDCADVAVSIRYSSYLRPTSTGDGNPRLLFASSHLLVHENPSIAVICFWRGNSHLRPLHPIRFDCPSAIPMSYWLLLLAGDVELHPGPVRFPCIECSHPVRSNQLEAHPHLLDIFNFRHSYISMF